MCKRLLIFSTALFLILSFGSCKKDVNDKLFEGPNSVVFEEENAEFTESDTFGFFTTRIVLVSKAFDKDITVNLKAVSLNGVGVIGEDFTLLTTSVVIPAGAYEAEVSYKLGENLNADGVKVFGIKLESNNGDLTMGFEGGNRKGTFEVTVQDNDCALDLISMGALDYVGTEDGYYNTSGDPSSGYIKFDPELEENDDPEYPNSLLSLNLGDWAGEPAILSFNTNVATPEIKVEPTFAFTAQGFDLYWIGTGKYVSCTNQIEITYALTFDDMETIAIDYVTDYFEPK